MTGGRGDARYVSARAGDEAPPTRDGWTPARLLAVREHQRRYAGDLKLVATCLNVTPEVLDLALHDLLGRSPGEAYAAILAREARQDPVVEEVRRLLAPLGLTVVAAAGAEGRP